MAACEWCFSRAVEGFHIGCCFSVHSFPTDQMPRTVAYTSRKRPSRPGDVGIADCGQTGLLDSGSGSRGINTTGAFPECRLPSLAVASRQPPRLRQTWGRPKRAVAKPLGALILARFALLPCFRCLFALKRLVPPLFQHPGPPRKWLRVGDDVVLDSLFRFHILFLSPCGLPSDRLQPCRSPGPPVYLYRSLAVVPSLARLVISSAG
jgi:hypothetical protein